jgi:hypothetical protein
MDRRTRIARSRRKETDAAARIHSKVCCCFRVKTGVAAPEHYYRFDSLSTKNGVGRPSPRGHNFGVRSLHDLKFGDIVKRIAAFMLLVVLTGAWSIPVKAQRISVEENARQSRRSAKKQQKMLKKANKKQSKAMKKYAKAQRKAAKRAQHRTG